MAALDRPALWRVVLEPLALMSQPWQRPDGPDGWPERAKVRVTPQFVAARLDWAVNRLERLVDLPGRRDLVEAALGPAAPEIVAAARAAERRAEGVGVVLASVDLQRR